MMGFCYKKACYTFYMHTLALKLHMYIVTYYLLIMKMGLTCIQNMY